MTQLSLILVESALQARQALRLMATYPNRNWALILRASGHAQTDRQLREAINAKGFQGRVYKIRLDRSGLLKPLQMLCLLRLVPLLLRASIFITGNPRSVLSKFFSVFYRNGIEAIDEGTLTLVEVDAINRGQMTDIRRWYTFFSTLQSNQIEIVRLPVMRQTVRTRRDLGWIIGGPFTELGHADVQLELNGIARMAEQLIQAGCSSITYVAHRYECDDKLARIAEACPVDQIVRFEQPVESEIIAQSTEGTAPAHVATILSTAAFIVLEELEGISVHVMKCQDLRPEHRSSATIIQSHLRQYPQVQWIASR